MELRSKNIFAKGREMPVSEEKKIKIKELQEGKKV